MTGLIENALDVVGASLRVVADRAELEALWRRLLPVIAVVEADPKLAADIIAAAKKIFPAAGAPPGGYSVTWIQQSLNAVAGEHLEVDGLYGTAVHAAVQRYQRSRNITPDDGWAGPVTCSVLFAEVTKQAGTPAAT
jgi:peptidoglycan hydrolase-like protein with peptidoglycan-binding domain